MSFSDTFQAYRSPWIVEAARAGALPLVRSIRPRGGKLDDCTVVVLFAMEPDMARAPQLAAFKQPVSAAAGAA